MIYLLDLPEGNTTRSNFVHLLKFLVYNKIMSPDHQQSIKIRKKKQKLKLKHAFLHSESTKSDL